MRPLRCPSPIKRQRHGPRRLTAACCLSNSLSLPPPPPWCPLTDEKTPPNTNTRRTAELAFKALDTDGSGGVNVDEFIKALERFGMHVRKPDPSLHIGGIPRCQDPPRAHPRPFCPLCPRSRACGLELAAFHGTPCRLCSTSTTAMDPVRQTTNDLTEPILTLCTG